MRYKILLLTLFSMISIFSKAQNPSGLPLPNNPTGYYNIGWYRSDSGNILANRQPNFTPLYPFTIVGYLNPGVDTGVWWSTGVTWYEIPKIGGGGGGGGGITQLTGDGTTPTGGGVQPFTLATVNTNVGSFGDASHVSDFTVNGKGLITSAGSIPIQITESQVTNLVSDLAGKQGTITLGSTLQYLRGDLSLATFPTNLSSFTNGPGYITTISGIAAGGALSGTYPNPGLAPVVTAGTCTNCALTYNSAGQITVASSGSGGGALTGGGGLSPLFTNGVSGSTLTFTAQTVTAYAAYGNFTNATATPSFGKIPIQALTFGTANQVLGGDGSGNPAFIASGTNINIAGGTISTTANVTFTNLTATGSVNFTGITSGGATDSILIINPSTGKVGWTSRFLTFSFVEGTSPIGTHGDSAQLGGILGAFFQPDTLYTNGQPFLITGLPSKSTLLSTDSVNITDLSGRQWKAPASAIGGGSQTLQQVFTVQGNRAILTVADTLDATASDLRLIGNIVPSTNGTSNLGNGTDNFLSVYTHQLSSNGGQIFNVATGNTYQYNVNGSGVDLITSTGQFIAGSTTSNNAWLQAAANTTTVASLYLAPSSTVNVSAPTSGMMWWNGTALDFYTGSSTVNLLAGGGGTIGGSIANTQVAYGSGTNTITGSANMTFNGTSLTLANDASIHGLTAGLGHNSVANNTAFGVNADVAITTGGFNTAFGSNAAASVTNAINNTAVGGFALLHDSTGTDNTALGFGALQTSAAASYNTALGSGALNANTTGADGTAVGTYSLHSNTTGYGNTAVGKWAISLNTTGQHNTAIGTGAGSTYTTGNENTDLGYLAGDLRNGGSFNLFAGSFSGQQQLQPMGVTSLGQSALAWNTIYSDTNSIAVGLRAFGSQFSTRPRKSTIGIGVDIDLSTVSNPGAEYINCIFIGDTTGATVGDTIRINSTNIAHGVRLHNDNQANFGSATQFITLGNGGVTTTVMNTFPNIAGSIVWNTTAGGFYVNNGSTWSALATGGAGVTTVGTFSASSQTNGATISGVTITFGPADGTNPGMIKASGAQTLGATLTVTNDMVVDGLAVGRGVHTVLQNTAFGNLALNAATGANNTAIGYVAGANITTGSSDAFLGSNAGKNTTTGASNIAMGASAFNNNTTGSFDVAIGAGALLTPSAVSNTVAIGYNALNALTNGINNLAIGYTTMQLDTSGANNIAVGNGSFLSLLSGGANFVMGNQSGNTLTTGSGNFLAGYKVDVASGSTSNTLDIAGLILGQGLSTAGGSGYLGGTLGLGTAGTTTAMVTVGIAPYNSSIGTGLVTATATSNDPVTSASGTVTDMAANVIGVPTFSATNTSVTYTNASSLYITGAPAAGTHVTITNPWSFKVAAGNSQFLGEVIIGTLTGSMTWNPSAQVLLSTGGPLNDATTAASGTVLNVYENNFNGSSLTATNTSVTYTNAYSVYINGAPAGGTNVTVTHPYALGVAGAAVFQTQLSTVSEAINSWQNVTSGTASTINNNQTNWLLNLSSLAATYTVTLPPNPVDGQMEKLFFGGTIAGGSTVVTSLTVSPNIGQTITQSSIPTTALSGNCYIYQYNAALAIWYRQQ